MEQICRAIKLSRPVQSVCLHTSSSSSLVGWSLAVSLAT
ncbi:hypothetical protein SLEP1_g35436 [Rubroshorea leprosula]|uniref:Uncharacterized protein n=1 Tax=Rubroshorea leprosula TaxID=152421 RepID=A0AAV5KN60_9ROSI|nr:hypothetical protein SLEP1_g35436 [Rubroshorea leprosula]